MRLSQTHESNWHETPCIKTVDLSCTHAADLPAGVLLCPECPRECVRVFTSEKARQAHRSRAHGHRAMARDFVSDEQCQRAAKYLARAPWRLNTCSAVHSDVDKKCWMACYPDPQQM